MRQATVPLVHGSFECAWEPPLSSLARTSSVPCCFFGAVYGGRCRALVAAGQHAADHLLQGLHHLLVVLLLRVFGALDSFSSLHRT